MDEPNTDLIQGTRLNSEWRQTDKSRRAKFYSLTRSGRKQLEVETANWNRRASAIARLLKAEG
jgi:DNA-binding PadR family transcriptional regulator